MALYKMRGSCGNNPDLTEKIHLLYNYFRRGLANILEVGRMTQEGGDEHMNDVEPAF